MIEPEAFLRELFDVAVAAAQPAAVGPEYEVTLRLTTEDGAGDVACRVDKQMLGELVKQLHDIKAHVASLT